MINISARLVLLYYYNGATPAAPAKSPPRYTIQKRGAKFGSVLRVMWASREREGCVPYTCAELFVFASNRARGVIPDSMQS